MTARKKPAKLLPCPVCWNKRPMKFLWLEDGIGDIWCGTDCFVCVRMPGMRSAVAAWNALPRRRAKAGKKEKP